MNATLPATDRKVRVLVFPCGAENGSEIFSALRYSVHVELFGASSVDDHGRFNFGNYQGDLPNIVAPDFLERFLELVRRWRIDVVFSTHDTVCEFLAMNADVLGCHVVNGDPDATRITRRKSLTYALFADRNWVPEVYADTDAVPEWPAVVKPDQGQGGRGIHFVEDAQEARRAIAMTESPLLVEYLPGEELTVDCFTDRHRRLAFVGPRTRERVRAGIAMRSRMLDDDPRITAIASEINERMALRGPWFFQVKGDRQGRWKLLEVSCRVAGSMVAQRARSVNLPLLAVLDYMGRDIMTMPEPSIRLIDRSIATHADMDFDFDNVFIDLDETLIINGAAVPEVMAFVYRMVEKKKRIVLITRHAHDVHDTLAHARIAPGLFDEIIHITDGRDKSDFVTARSVFVDNHFPERRSVALRHHIPVFDVDALEFLR